ncbi:MAG: ParB N-terminal domain-containing protein [Allosphingosinicella sp.]|uniref:ParB/RepB/Spo0J family partition protein n=1 Tax=Allosphingosinicella sp. TaxID=2823234 RepID=UPI00393429D8
MIRTIPLNKLMPSPRNVRRTTDEQADLQLKADIEARGLLQNLVVAPAKKPKGRFTVEAGGRRLRALASLAEEGKLVAEHEVCCLVIDSGPAAAQEAGLAENFQRLAMNPADECLAFQQLIEQGADIEGIARRFGLTVRFVEGRLRLASLAPVVFAALGAGEITLDVAKAYAATPDLERQAFVFEQVSRSYMAQHPDSIRRMMTQATVSASDRRAKFVGEEVYVAAGGRIERDLFSDEDGARWLDIALLERLATEKLDALAAETTASSGLAFVRPTLESWSGYEVTRGLQRVQLETPPLSEEESAEVAALEAETEDLIGQLEDEETAEEARDAAEARVREIGARIDAITDKPPVIPEELKPRIGTFMLLDETGQPRLDTSYYVEPSHEPEEPTEPTATDAGADAREAPVIVAEPPIKQASLSQTLADELAMQRRDILAVHVAADQGLALDLAIFLMIDREAGYSSEKTGSSLLALPPSDPVFGFKTPDAAATRARGQTAEALDRSWTAADTRAGRFDAFRALPDEARAAWLGHAVARTLEASLNLPGGRVCPFHDHLGRLLGINVAKWWRPTGANFFDRVAKSVTLSALEEVGGSAFAYGYSKAKKAELSETAERIFAGNIAPADVKKRALAWVPEPMRFAPLQDSAAPADHETPPWEDEKDSKSPGSAGIASASENERGGELTSPASGAAEGEVRAAPPSSRRRRGSGKKTGVMVPAGVLEEAA